MRAYYDSDGSRALAALPSPRPSRPNPILKSMLRVTRNSLLLVALLVVMLGTAGCVYRANVSQGNLVEEEDLDQVEIGMTRSQVRFLLGTPMVDDPFHSDRWDYVYYLKIGRNQAVAKRWVSIVFVDNVVSEIRRNQELNPDL